MTFAISVVVCSYKRHELLQSTLKHFGEMHTPSGAVELLVVENSPHADRVQIDLPNGFAARTIVCDQVGLSHARNAGIRESKGAVIAFLDDDALVCQDWALTIARIFQQKKIKALGGRVTPKMLLSPLPDWYYPELAGYLSCIDWGRDARFLKPGEWIVGANMAFSRDVFKTEGTFDPSLGRRGDASLLSNEEIALLEKIGLNNVYYSPECSVEHIIQPERIRLEWFRKRVFWQAISDLLAGIQHQSHAAMDDEYRSIATQLPAQFRNINMLSFKPTTQVEFRHQLRAIYLCTCLGGNGFQLT
jgi:glycosyltransferase involved in cell wall biosynthesis